MERKNPLEEQVGGSHYKDMLIQPIEVMTTLGWDYTQGAIFKYVARHRSKNGREDLEKAVHLANIGAEYGYDQGSSVSCATRAYIKTYCRLMGYGQDMERLMMCIDMKMYAEIEESITDMISCEYGAGE